MRARLLIKRLRESSQKLLAAVTPGTGSQVLSVILFVVYCTLRIVNLSAIQEVRQFPDTISYTRMASLPLWKLGFWGGRGSRPWTVPLFYKLLGNDPLWISIFQCGFSLLCWGLLALSVARAVRLQWLKPGAFAVILLFSLGADIIMWDAMMLSDSIALSLMALLIVGFHQYGTPAVQKHGTPGS